MFALTEEGGTQETITFRMGTKKWSPTNAYYKTLEIKHGDTERITLVGGSSPTPYSILHGYWRVTGNLLIGITEMNVGLEIVGIKNRLDAIEQRLNTIEYELWN